MYRHVFSKQNLPILGGLVLGGAAAYYLTVANPLRADSKPTGALDPSQYLPIPVASSKYISKDTKEIVFELPKNQSLGGETAYMVLFRFKNQHGKHVIRPYTPVSEPEKTGSATFVVKAYPDGKMSQHLHGLNVGETIEMKGPMQKYKLEENQHKKIALIGGGSGITPLFQILQKVADDSNDKTQVELFYGSNTPEDVLLKSEIDSLVAKKPGQLKVTYFVAKDPSNSFQGEKGFITSDFLKKNLFKPTDDNVKVFVCGPPPLYEAISGNKKSPSDQGELTGALKDLGFKSDQVFKF